jgi:hypothetical protein
LDTTSYIKTIFWRIKEKELHTALTRFTRLHHGCVTITGLWDVRTFSVAD